MTNFCTCCGLPMDKNWNKRYDPNFKDKRFCRKECYFAWIKKENNRLKKQAPKYGVLAI